MNLYVRFLLPSLVTSACACSPIDKQRQKIVPSAEGVVLELGFGAGLNLPHYDAAKVRKLYALEPSPGMVKRASDRVRNAPFDVEILPETAEALSLAPPASTPCSLPIPCARSPAGSPRSKPRAAP